MKYYHPGVGTDGSLWNRVAGGGMGLGLDRNIQSGYKWLATQYRPGDRIFLFGFSRGAYTVRSLGGMITACGLLDFARPEGAPLSPEETWEQVGKVFDCYRTPKPERQGNAMLAGLVFHDAPSHATAPGAVPIHLIGVWDTVGALGIPEDFAFLELIEDPAKHTFHDTDLNPRVLNARHAVAIDEMRQSFTPTLWTNVADRRDTVKQIWFPGVHSDIGGGYARCGLADGALGWMISEAKGLGLAVRDSAVAQLRPDPRDVLHDSRTGLFKSLKSLPRNVPNLRGVDEGVFHDSALCRHKDPPLSEAHYRRTIVLRPGESRTVDVFAAQRWNATAIFLEDGAEFDLSATGQWLDGSITCGPDGSKDGKFDLGEIVYVAGSVLSGLERGLKAASGSPDVDLWWTRRLEDFPWFGLIGVITNGRPAPAGGRAVPHQTFLIGSKAIIRPAGSGYLYCFANDAWHAYENNRGSVTLTITRK